MANTHQDSQSDEFEQVQVTSYRQPLHPRQLRQPRRDEGDLPLTSKDIDAYLKLYGGLFGGLIGLLTAVILIATFIIVHYSGNSSDGGNNGAQFNELTNQIDAKFNEQSDELTNQIDAKFNEQSDSNGAQFNQLTGQIGTLQTMSETTNNNIDTLETKISANFTDMLREYREMNDTLREQLSTAKAEIHGNLTVEFETNTKLTVEKYNEFMGKCHSACSSNCWAECTDEAAKALPHSV